MRILCQHSSQKVEQSDEERSCSNLFLLASTMKSWIPVQAFGRLVQVGRFGYVLGGRVHMRLLFDSHIFQFTRSTANISFTGYEWTQRRWLPSPKANNKSSAARPLAQQRAQNSSALILPAIIGKSTMPVMMLSTKTSSVC